MTLAEFLSAVFEGFERRSVRFCVLRNYEGLPESNVGSDVDLLIEPADVGKAVDALRSVPGIMITDVSDRPYVTSTFVHGVDEGCLQVDFFTALAWRGIDYLRVGSVLDRVKQHPNCNWIPVPDPIDEGIVSFFTSYAIGGFVKERYGAAYLPAFGNHPDVVAKRVTANVDVDILRQLMRLVTNDEIEATERLVGQFRRSLLLRALARRPLTVLAGLARHFAAEIRIHFSQRNVHTVAVFGPDGAGKSSVIAALERRLPHCSKNVETRHLRPPLPGRWRVDADTGPVVDPHGRPPKSAVASAAQMAMWLAAYWLDRFLRRKVNATLLIYDRYMHDVLVDPKRYRYGGPAWFARLMSGLTPRLDLVFVLDAPASILQQRKQEVPIEETERQRDAYRRLASTFAEAHVLDASESVDEIAERARTVVLRFLAAQASRRLPGRDT